MSQNFCAQGQNRWGLDELGVEGYSSKNICDSLDRESGDVGQSFPLSMFLVRG